MNVDLKENLPFKRDRRQTVELFEANNNGLSISFSPFPFSFMCMHKLLTYGKSLNILVINLQWLLNRVKLSILIILFINAIVIIATVNYISIHTVGKPFIPWLQILTRIICLLPMLSWHPLINAIMWLSIILIVDSLLLTLLLFRHR